ncbi:hypothetical protein AGLY_006971 [Aphis glycines]|uniref:Uncharacterized protein n=1 Tax=Aphis glycines TaxID=307491 RepID=A0A6G0TQZ4_APHGL|nr:hypothetical protein AGLY_006971 [Aphis glycines]
MYFLCVLKNILIASCQMNFIFTRNINCGQTHPKEKLLTEGSCPTPSTKLSRNGCRLECHLIIYYNSIMHNAVCFTAAKIEFIFFQKRIPILDSERSDECIDFTMMYIFFLFVFVSVYSITSRNNASISNFGSGFRWKSKYPWCIIEEKSKHFPTVFKKSRKTKKKTEKREFLRKISFRPNRFFYMVTTEIFDFYANFFFEVSVGSDQKNLKINTRFLIITIFFYKRLYTSNFYEICQKRENLQVFLQVAIEKTRSIIIGKIFLISYSYNDLKIIRIYWHNFFLLAFEVEILTKIRQNHEYLQIIFPRSTPPPNVQQNGTHLPFLISYSYSDYKIIRIHRHNFFLLAFEVEILTKIRQNHEYLQIILLTNHRCSESFPYTMITIIGILDSNLTLL